MFQRISKYTRSLGLHSLLKSSRNQSTVNRLLKDCPICHGDMEHCQSPKCFQTWQVYSESPKIDMHDNFRKGRLLFEQEAFYWQVIPSAINHEEFYHWESGGVILKKGVEAPPR